MKPLVLFGVCSMLLSFHAAAQPVYKCAANGHTTYTDRPCGPDAVASSMPALIVTPPPTRTERSLARAYDERIARERAERDRGDAEWLAQHAQRRDHEARVRKAIIEHRVLKSMTRDEVKQALGEPDRVESGDSFGTAKETWLYVADGKTRRVNFKDGEVTTTQLAASRPPRAGRHRR